jgi:hypothetical protein
MLHAVTMQHCCRTVSNATQHTECQQASCISCSFKQALLPAVGYAAPAGSGGIFYKGDGKQLGIQLLGALVVFLWSLGLSLALFMLLKALKLLRVPAASEGIGERWLNGACTRAMPCHAPCAPDVQCPGFDMSGNDRAVLLHCIEDRLISITAARR